MYSKKNFLSNLLKGKKELGMSTYFQGFCMLKESGITSYFTKDGYEDCNQVGCPPNAMSPFDENVFHCHLCCYGNITGE